MTKKVLVTGATGFVGGGVVRRLQAGQEHDLILVARGRNPGLPAGLRSVQVEDLSSFTDWSTACSGVNVVVHCAARTHIMNDEVIDPLSEYRRVNVEGTLNLARQAVKEGVKRFVFVSSIKVNGESTPSGNPFRTDDDPVPLDPYGISKWEAEQGLFELSRQTGLEVVIIRAPLVYGPGVKGNFGSLLRLVELGLPLPLGAVDNKRSLVALDNLSDLIVTCIDHASAANHVFLAGDGEDLSTPELLRRIGKALGKPVRLIPVPSGLLFFGAALLGKKDLATRVVGSLQVDISDTRGVLGWAPPISVEEGLRRCVNVEVPC